MIHIYNVKFSEREGRWVVRRGHVDGIWNKSSDLEDLQTWMRKEIIGNKLNAEIRIYDPHVEDGHVYTAEVYHNGVCSETLGELEADKATPSPAYPAVPINRKWDLGKRGEEVQGLGNRYWRINDLQEVVKDQPVFEVPLAFLDLAAHDFHDEGGLIAFAEHMRHVNDADLDYPIIFDQWGRILDGRHRIVKALLEGRTTIKAQKVPDEASPTYRK